MCEVKKTKQNKKTLKILTKNNRLHYDDYDDYDEYYDDFNKIFTSSKIFIFFVYMYKMLTYSIETWRSTIGVEVIKYNDKK